MENKITVCAGIEFGGGVAVCPMINDDGVIFLEILQSKNSSNKLGENVRRKDCLQNIQIHLIFPTLESLKNFRDNALVECETKYNEWVKERNNQVI